jgi:hypothetical protein
MKFFSAVLLGGLLTLVAAYYVACLPAARLSQKMFSHTARSQPTAPIELLHSTSETLSGLGIVRGLVRNPGPATLSLVRVRCKILDARGQIVGTGEHYIDSSDLGPGAESLFHVSTSDLTGKPDSYTLSFHVRDGAKLETRDLRTN